MSRRGDHKSATKVFVFSLLFFFLLKNFQKRLLIGSDGVVVSMDIAERSPAQFLACPEEGEVLAIAATGLNACVAALRRRGADTGLVCSWSFN